MSYRIYVDGLYRDMTAEEEAQFIRDHENLPPIPEEGLFKDKAEAYDILIGGTE